MKAAKRGITLDYSVLHPWRPVDDVTSIHWTRLRGQRWPTTGHSRTQRGTGLLPFPRGSGVTAAYKERIPTGTLHPLSPSTPTLAPHYSARRFPGTSVAFPWQQPLTEMGWLCQEMQQEGVQMRRREMKTRVTRTQRTARCKSNSWLGWVETQWKLSEQVLTWLQNWRARVNIYQQHRPVLFNTTDENFLRLIFRSQSLFIFSYL